MEVAYNEFYEQVREVDGPEDVAVEGDINADMPVQGNIAGLSSKDIIKAFRNNEQGDADLYAALNRGHFVFDAAANRWNKYKEHSWAVDFLNDAMGEGIDRVIDVFAREMGRQAWLRQKAIRVKDNAGAEAHKKLEDLLAKRINALQSVGRRQNVLLLARTGAGSLAIRGDEWDQDPWALGCLNGIIDLRTGKLRDGQPEDYIKTVAPTKYTGIDTPAPVFEKFFNDIFDGVQELIDHVHKALGYAIAGVVTWHIILIFWGAEGRNGKGSLLEIIKFVLGKLAVKVRAEVMLDSGHSPGRGSADADTLSLLGSRIAWGSETGKGKKLDGSKTKELSGGDTLTARPLYGRDNIEFTPTHTLILLTNFKPQVHAGDDALWERIHLIPFNVRFVDSPAKSNERKADHDLMEKLKAESSGILAWLVRGCLKWQQKGLIPPDCVRAATSKYRKEEDIVDRFLTDENLIGEDRETRASELYTAYSRWAVNNGLTPMTSILFGKEMGRRFESYTKRHVFYKGVGWPRENVQ